MPVINGHDSAGWTSHPVAEADNRQFLPVFLSDNWHAGCNLTRRWRNQWKETIPMKKVWIGLTVGLLMMGMLGLATAAPRRSGKGKSGTVKQNRDGNQTSQTRSRSSQRQGQNAENGTRARQQRRDGSGEGQQKKRGQNDTTAGQKSGKDNNGQGNSAGQGQGQMKRQGQNGENGNGSGQNGQNTQTRTRKKDGTGK
ncbi:MAG: hypothetical protein JXQ27_00115 [Acidobacteria bacterium]|nr:hypothetical protein [Acidobacteriota bacterium]